jgi:hypothetical protein
VGEIDAHITGDNFFWGKKNSDSWGTLARVGATAAGTSRWATHAVGGGGAGRACAGPWEWWGLRAREAEWPRNGARGGVVKVA